MRRFLTPKWLGWHALLLTSLGVLGWIGAWQLGKARDAGDWQNYGYAVQWWLFAGFAVFLWWKLVLDELDPHRRERAEAPVALPAPDTRPAATTAQQDDGDDELAAYNAHLRRLAEQQR